MAKPKKQKVVLDNVNQNETVSEEVVEEETIQEEAVEEDIQEEVVEETKQEPEEEVYCGYKIVTEQPNGVNNKMRVIISTMHGTHVKEWIIGEAGIQKAKDYINGVR